MPPGPLGIVIAHGKWDKRPFATAGLAEALRAAGHAVIAPELPWSLNRLYDAPFEQAVDDLAGALDALRDRGCSRLLLCGHSLGANAALACAGNQPVDGVIALAPGHFPEQMHAAGFTAQALATARAALAAGEDGRIMLTDVFQGAPRRLRLHPAHYLGYFAPDGPAVVPAHCRRLGNGPPLLWVVGRDDPHFALGADYAYAQAPSHPASRYVEIDADHVSTPDAAVATVLAWLAQTFLPTALSPTEAPP